MIRDFLIRGETQPFVLFHDSDDLSCTDRVRWLSSAINNGDLDLVGSHELRLDEMRRQIIAVRYPLDVIRALGSGSTHPQLHPSTMLRRDAYSRIGGFSTFTVFGADTQFLLRAYFRARIRNVDEFLYIRRRHTDALTMRPDTGYGTPARLSVEAPWRADFKMILSGGKRLEDSSLLPRTTLQRHEICEVRVESPLTVDNVRAPSESGGIRSLTGQTLPTPSWLKREE